MKDHDERLWRKEGHEEGRRSRCAYLWWEWRLIWLMQMNVAGVYRWISNETAPPVRSDHHQSDIIKDTLTEQNTRPEKHLFSTQPAVPHRESTHTHFFSFQGDELFQWHSFREAQLTLRMIHQHRPRVKSNARRHHVRRGGCREGGDLHRNNHIFNQRDHLTKIIRRTEAAKAKHTWRNKLISY